MGRDDDPISRLDHLRRGSNAIDHPERLVAEDKTTSGTRSAVVHVQVGPADRARRHADHRVGRLLDFGVRHLANGDRPDVGEDHGLHLATSVRFGLTMPRCEPAGVATTLTPRSSCCALRFTLLA